MIPTYQKSTYSATRSEHSAVTKKCKSIFVQIEMFGRVFVNLWGIEGMNGRYLSGLKSVE